MSAVVGAEPLGEQPAEEPIAVSYPRISTPGLVANLSIGFFGLIFAGPMLWLFLSSIDSQASWQVKLPHLTTANYRAVLHESTLRPIWNSFYLAGVSTALTVVLAVLCGFALSKRAVPLKRTFMIAILFSTGIPITMMIVPVYQLFVDLNWLDSLFTTSLFLAASSLPFAIWLMKNFIDAVPDELEEAASLEGVGSLRILVQIVIPLTMPGIFVTAIVTFINSWGAFLIPLVLNSNPNDTPGSIAVYNYLSAFVTPQFGPLAAYSIVFSLPVLLLYLAMARRLSGAFTFGGSVKG